MPDLLIVERGRTRVTVAPAYGGRIAQIEVDLDGRRAPLLHEPLQSMSERDPLAWGSYALVPWPNRIAGGRFEFAGQTYTVPVNQNGNALHGFGYTAAWEVAEATGDACSLTFEVPPAWPFGGRAEQRIEALEDGLRQRVTLHADAVPYPCGTAWHPWLRREVDGLGPLRLRIDADERYELVDMIPTGRIVPLSGDFDFRDGPEVGERRLDDCYRNVRGPMRLQWGDRLGLTMSSSTNCMFAVVYTHHPDAICIEPQTCAIDAFNLAARGDSASGVAMASPNVPFVAETEWRWSLHR